MIDRVGLTDPDYIGVNKRIRNATVLYMYFLQ